MTFAYHKMTFAPDASQPISRQLSFLRSDSAANTELQLELELTSLFDEDLAELAGELIICACENTSASKI